MLPAPVLFTAVSTFLSSGNRVGDDVEARLRAAQDAGVAEVAATAEVQKRRVQKELEQAGATEEEREVGTPAVCWVTLNV